MPMADTKQCPLFFLFIFSSSLLSIHARESQFFSKFSNNIPTNQPQLSNTKQQDPSFITEQEGDSYGLYGHLPPSTAATTTANDNLPTTLPENYNTVAYTTPIHHTHSQNLPYNYNMDSYVTGPQTYKYNDNSNMYNSYEQETGTYGGNNLYNTQRQGMSDTRFMENGKYYYDLNSENFHANENVKSGGFGLRNGYNSQGYYGNNENSYNRYDPHAEYQYQEKQENEFVP